MNDSFELLDNLYDKFLQNDKLMELLGNPQEVEEQSAKIRKEVTPLDYATEENVNFISMYLSSATETDNIYVVRAFLNIDYFAGTPYDLAEMTRIVTEILREQDIFCTSMYSMPSDTKGVYRYTQKFRPLIWS